MEPHDIRFFATPQELRDWFDAHHETAEELWLGYYRRSTGIPSVDWSQAVDEALCVGWIDGIRHRLDDRRFVQRFTPRRKRSTWSDVNVAKVAVLTAEGRMRPAGIAAFAARTAGNTGIYSYEGVAAAFRPEELDRLRADDAAWADWQRRPPSYRKSVTFWVTSARKPETRERRLRTLIEESREGRKVGPMRERVVSPAGPAGPGPGGDPPTLG